MTSARPSGATRRPAHPAHESGGSAFSVAGLHLLEETIRDARHAAAAPVAGLLETAPDGAAAGLAERECTFDHCAVLLFPVTLTAGLRHLEEQGLAPLPTVPSTVVRARLAERHGLDPAGCEVHITRLLLDLPDGHRRPLVEVFLFPRDSGAFDGRIEATEYAHGFECHTAFVVRRPSAPLLRELVAAWHAEGLLWEGGGHNPHEGGPHGSSVTYFVRDHRRPAGRRRFELHCAGDLRAALGGRPRPADAVRRAYQDWPRRATHPGA